MGQKGRISRMTLEELRRLRVAGSEPIPTLEEALALVRGQMIVNVELKQSGRLYPGFEAVAKTITALDMTSEVIVTSFDHFSLVEFRRHMPETALGPIVYGTSSDLFHWMRQMEARYLSIKYTYLTPSLIRACKEEEMRSSLGRSTTERRWNGYTLGTRPSSSARTNWNCGSQNSNPKRKADERNGEQKCDQGEIKGERPAIPGITGSRIAGTRVAWITRITGIAPARNAGVLTRFRRTGGAMVHFFRLFLRACFPGNSRTRRWGEKNIFPSRTSLTMP